MSLKFVKFVICTSPYLSSVFIVQISHLGLKITFMFVLDEDGLFLYILCKFHCILQTRARRNENYMSECLVMSSYVVWCDCLCYPLQLYLCAWIFDRIPV